MSALLELAKRCEKATGPDRELDAAVMDALRIGEYRTKNGLLGYPLEPKPYTASLDAAMTLVPEINGQTAYPQLQRVGVDVWQAHLGYANKAKGATGNAQSPALALCAAALKARAASADTRPEGGDSTKIEAPFTGGAVPEGQTPNLPPDPPE